MISNGSLKISRTNIGNYTPSLIYTDKIYRGQNITKYNASKNNMFFAKLESSSKLTSCKGKIEDNFDPRCNQSNTFLHMININRKS